MKLIVHSLALAALFTCAIQADVSCSKKIPVTARKKDPKTDTKRIIVKITSDSEPISSSSFIKNTTGLRTNKLHFCFERNQSNDIQVFEGDQLLFNANKSVSEQEGRYGADLIIDTATQTVDINYKKPKTIKATLVLPKDSGAWLVVSGDKDYKSEGALSDSPLAKGILEKKTFQAATPKNSIAVYKNMDIKLFAHKTGTPNSTGAETTIDQATVKKAGSKPVIVIDPTTSAASILSSLQYAKNAVVRAISSK